MVRSRRSIDGLKGSLPLIAVCSITHRIKRDGSDDPRKTGAVVTSTVPDPPFRAEWTARARTLLAEAVASGLPPDEVLTTCRSVLDSFGTAQPEDTP
jgi:hypothetical protein